MSLYLYVVKKKRLNESQNVVNSFDLMRETWDHGQIVDGKFSRGRRTSPIEWDKPCQSLRGSRPHEENVCLCRLGQCQPKVYIILYTQKTYLTFEIHFAYIRGIYTRKDTKFNNHNFCCNMPLKWAVFKRQFSLI